MHIQHILKTAICAVVFLVMSCKCVNYTTMRMNCAMAVHLKRKTFKCEASFTTQSFKKMDNRKNCIDACLACLVESEKCATMCGTMPGHEACVKICRDCADICALFARLCARDSQFSDALCALCVKCCEACAAECGKHADHTECCKACAEACRKCAEACKM